MHSRGEPVLVAGQLGQRFHQAVGHHAEQGQFVRGAAVPFALVTAQHVAEAEFFPERAHHVHRAQRARPLDFDRLAGSGELGRHLQAVLADADDAAGELVILGHRAILVTAARDAQVHAYIIRATVLFNAIFCTWRVATHLACWRDRTRDFAGDSRR